MAKSKSAGAIQDKPDKPYISASKTLPEITVKSLILGVLLAMLLAGSNAYLGLRIGQTVTACIPAAVISMAILRFFRESNILENNMVQTIASAGEVVAAAVIFTLPALVIMGFWQGFPYLQTTSIAVIGSVLGVLFSVPLRRALIVETRLSFPEGVATAEVLKAGENSKNSAENDSSAALLLVGGLLSAGIKFLQSGVQIVGEELLKWWRIGSSEAVTGFGLSLAPVTISAGYIVGLRVAISLFLGTVLTWFVALPLESYFGGYSMTVPLGNAAMEIWSTKLRYLGVGAMVVGGIWALVSLTKPIVEGVRSSMNALKHAGENEDKKLPRTERDISMKWVIMGTLALAVPVFVLFTYVIDSNHMPVSSGLFWSATAFLAIFALVCGFICSSIAGYMTGIIGSSSNPLSGVVIAAILGVSFLLLGLLSIEVDFTVHTDDALSSAATAVIIGAVVACAAAISGDNLQDLKTGHMVGATPWKQETMLIVGAVAGSLVITPILSLLYEAYGMGGTFPREGMDITQSLPAPQATLMASVAKGVFLGGLPWLHIILGAVMGCMLIILNAILKVRGSDWNFPVLAVALGLYLPFYVTVAFFVGGVLKEISTRTLAKKRRNKIMSASDVEIAEKHGMLFASGSIAGEALMGISLAIPFALSQSTSVFKLDFGMGSDQLMLSGAAVMAAFLYYFHRKATTVR